MNKIISHTTTHRLLSVAAVALLLISAVMASPVSKAAPSPSQPLQGGQAFSISPPLIELQGNPGDVVKTQIKFTNISKDELLVKTQFNDFGAKNETGEPNILFEDTDNKAFSLRSWIGSPTPFKIASKETKTIEFPISIPKNAEPGGHYAVIRFTGSSPELENNGVALNASIGSLVLLRVNGNVQEKASMADFFAATPQFEKSSFFEQAPINLVERVHNEGNIHLKPTGTLRVKDMFGKEVASMRVNGDPANQKDPPRSVLPDSIRRFEQKIDMPWMFGRYEATVDLGYGQDNAKKLTATTNFWIIPYKLITLIIAALIVLFFLLRFAIKRYNKYIINKAKTPEESSVGNDDNKQL